jgi:BirA family biotin operon repressor/biotin-[acetyl-CoA-carboxylase] ligase
MRKQAIITNLEVLPYLVGLAVYVTITKYVQYEKVTLKWPNDVLVIGRKISGVLIERSTNTDAVIIGIGLNIVNAPQLSGYLTCALSDFIPIPPTRDQILKDLLDALDKYLLLFDQVGKQEIYRLWNKYSYKNGQKTTIKVNNKTYNGIFKGINNNGELVLATPESNKFFRSIDEFI